MSYIDEDINQYLIAFKEGDRSQFDSFYEKYHDRFLSYAVYYLVNKDNREDVISETYIKICKRIYAFDPAKGDGYDWIIKIIQNTAKTFNQKDLKYKTVEINNIYLADEHDSYSEADIELFLEKTFKKKDYKNYVIAMLIIKGRKQKEIAKMLGISESAVSQRMNKIRAIIENYLKNI